MSKEKNMTSAEIDAEVSAIEKKIREQQKTSRRVKIRIPSDNSSSGSSSVSVGVNGTGYVIKRDEDVEVPEGVYNTLLLARMSLYDVKEEYGQKKTVVREVQRFPLLFLGYVDNKEVAAR